MSRHFFSLLLSLLLVNATAQKKKVDVLIQAATIIDVEHGKLIPGKTIAIKGSNIVAVVNNQAADSFEAANTIDAKGKYIMPGLWDMHMHFGGGDTLIEENKNLLMLYLANGITSVRDCAADISPSVLQWRKAINAGSLKGPTIYTAGPKLEGYKSIWAGDIEVDNRAELNKAIDSLQKISVDFVKITDNTMKPALYLEALTETRKRRFQITGHIPAALTLTQVSNAGLSAIEHIGYLLRAGNNDEAGYSTKIASGQFTARDYNKILLQNFDTAAAMKVYRQLAKNGTAVVPTLSISYTVAYLDQNDHNNDDYLQYIGKGLRNTYNWRVERAAKDSADAIQFRHELFERSAGLLRLLQKAGVKIIAGTDAGYLNSFDYPGLSLHKELALMVKYGLTPLQALQASVINGPAFFKRGAVYGSIAAGKMADLLLLDENPLQNITATEKINTVIVKGDVYNRQRLDELLQEVKRRAASN
jgi:imidazolonepropionase-like amidohydrolase